MLSPNSGKNNVKNNNNKRPPDDNTPPRRSSRPKKERDFLYQEVEVERGVLEFRMVEGCGLEQPGSRKMSPEEKQDLEKRDQGKEVFDKFLHPEGWTWAHRTSCGSGYVFRAPGVTKAKENEGENAFFSYQAIWEKYEQDGKKPDSILERARQSVEGADAAAKDEQQESPPAAATASTAPAAAAAVAAATSTSTATADDHSGAPEKVIGSNPLPSAGVDAAAAPIPSSQEVITIKEEDSDDGAVHPVRWSLRRRFERIEDACGYTPGTYSSEPNIRGLRRLEKDILDIEGAVGSFLQRVKVLEEAIGLPPVRSF